MELSSLWYWPVTDMFIHLDKVYSTYKNITLLGLFEHFSVFLKRPSGQPSERLIGLPDSMLKNRSNPQVVPSLEGLFIEDIAVGCEHVLALSSTGDIYAWGCNSEGQVNQNPPS